MSVVVVVGCGEGVVVCDVVVSVPEVVVSVPEVVVPVPEVVVSVGMPMSVVDKGTLVVNVVESSDGVMTKGSLPRVVAGAGCVVIGVVSTVVGGLLHSSDIWTTATTNAAMRAAPIPPAVKVAACVRYQGCLSGSGAGATGADPSPTRRPVLARMLDDR